MSNEKEINENIELIRHKIDELKRYPAIVGVMKQNLDIELKKLADLKSKPTVTQEVLDSLRETFKDVSKSTAEYWDEIAREHGTNTVKDKIILSPWVMGLNQVRMINNDLAPVSMENKVVKVPEFNSKCWLCGTPCNRDGKVSMCAGGCK